MTSIELNTRVMSGIVAGAIIIIGGSFYAGMQYRQSTAMGILGRGPAGAPGNPAMGGVQRGGRVGGGIGFTGGTIISKDAQSVTVKLMTPPGATADTSNNAGSRVIFLNDKTQVGKFSIGTAGDLAVGDTITVNGTPNSDGSIVAQMIQIRPAGMQGPGGDMRGGQAGPQGAPTSPQRGAPTPMTR